MAPSSDCHGELLTRWKKPSDDLKKFGQRNKKSDIKFGDDKYHQFETTTGIIHSKEASQMHYEAPKVLDQRHECHIAFGDQKNTIPDFKSTSALMSHEMGMCQKSMRVPLPPAGVGNQASGNYHQTGINFSKTNFKSPLDPSRFDSFVTSNQLTFEDPKVYQSNKFFLHNINREKNTVDAEKYRMGHSKSNIPWGDPSKVERYTTITKASFKAPAPGCDGKQPPILSTHVCHLNPEYIGGTNDFRYAAPYHTVHQEEYEKKRVRPVTPLDITHLREKSSVKFGDEWHNKTLKSVTGADFIPELNPSQLTSTSKPSQLVTPSLSQLGVLGALKGSHILFNPEKKSIQRNDFSDYSTSTIQNQEPSVPSSQRNASCLHYGDDRVKNFVTSNAIDFRSRQTAGCRPCLPQKNLITQTQFRLAHGDPDTDGYDPRLQYSTTHRREFESKMIPIPEERQHCLDTLRLGDQTRPESLRLLNSKETTSHYSYQSPGYTVPNKRPIQKEPAIKRIIHSHFDNSDIYTTTNDQFFKHDYENNPASTLVDHQDAILARQSFVAEDSIPRGDREKIKCGDTIYRLSFIPPTSV